MGAASAIATRENYTFRPLRVGFLLATSTETIILRQLDAVKNMTATATLDFRAAYDSVPRKFIMEIIQESTGPNLAKMGAMALQLFVVKTKHDDTDKTVEEKIGVPQEFPLSLTPFNIFMDTYAEAVIEKTGIGHERDSQQWACCLFADDIKLQARNMKVIKQLLGISEKWARKTR